MAHERSRLELARWYVRRPGTWGEFARGILAKTRPAPDERQDAVEACVQWQVDRAAAAEQFGVELVDVTGIDEYIAARSLLKERGIEVAGAGDTIMLYSVCLGLKPARVLETGVAHGLSSLSFLLAMEATGHGRLVSVDMPYRGSQDDGYVGQAVPDRLRTNWTLYRMPDRRGIPRALRSDQTVDLVHYDSDKTRSGREFAYPLLWGAVRSGGWLISDDVGDDLTFLEFAEQVGVQPVVWQKADGKDYVGAIRKP